MNSPENPEATVSPEAPQAETSGLNKKTKYSHSRTGYVARLPKKLRDQVNQMMLDGHTYLQIIEALGDPGKHLNEDNLSSWKSGGYLEFRREHAEMEEARVRNEFAEEFARMAPGTTVCERTLKTLIAQVLDGVHESGTGTLQAALIEKPELYVRLLHAVARLSAGTATLERQRLAEARLNAELGTDNKNPEDRAVTNNTLEAVDNLLLNR